MAEKPGILLIPGAWHQGSTFEPVAHILRSLGYQAETVTLPSAGGPPSTTAYDDAEHIRKAHLDNFIAQGKNIIIVMHSYAGLPGTESVKGLTCRDLAAEGKNGGVAGLVYMSTLIPRAGASIETLLPTGMDSMMTMEGDKMYPKNPREMFYNDLDDETASKHVAAIVHHSLEAMRTPLTYEAYRDVPTSYIICARDAGFPLAAQEKVATMAGEGVRTYTVDAGHFAMLSQPQAVADIVHDVAMRAADV